MEAHNNQTMYSDYKIVSSTESENLVEITNRLFDFGYIPLGGIAVETFNGFSRYHQAVAKVTNNGATGQKTSGRKDS